MEYLWWALVVMATVIYPAVLLRCALRGHRWAEDTLVAMRYVGGDLMTSSSWVAPPPRLEPIEQVPTRERVFEA